MKVFLISGYIGSGKTTAGIILTRNLPNSVRIPFAHFLKEISESIIMLLTGEHLEKEKHRWFLIEFAQLIKKHFGEIVWAKKVVEQVPPDVDNLIIDDWRFVEEYNYIAKVFGEKNIIKIRLINDSLSDEYKFDPSENTIASMDLSNFDYVYRNNGTVEDLSNWCYKVIDEESK